MAKNYKLLAESIRGRINPEDFTLQKSFSDELSTISYSEVLTYIRLSMKGVEPEYTQRSRDAGERVKEHLLKGLSRVKFEYQGSVMTDTHIKGYSDIDLLTICDKFYQYDSSGVRELLGDASKKARYRQASIDKLQKELDTTNYTGNSLEDLKNLRLDSEKILAGVYSECDITKPKAIKIKNLSMKREVDVVIANWYDDVSSIINDKGENRGIQIYNKDTGTRERADFPFLSIKRINERSSETNGRLKRMIRFLKNCKANSEQKPEIDLSSFTINAICYDIEISTYKDLSFYELVPVIYNQMKSICTDTNHSERLISVDGRESIFRGHPKKLENLKLLLAEVEGIFLDLKKTLGA